MNVVEVQVLSLLGLFVGMMGAFFLPYCFISRRPDSFHGFRYQLGISLANCFSGGVFVATFFIGLMPEVRELFQNLMSSNKIMSEFPMTEFVIFLGFLLAFGIEQYVMEYREKHNSAYTSVSSKSPDEYKKNEPETSPNNKNFSYELTTDCDGDVFLKTALMTEKEHNSACDEIPHSHHSNYHMGHSHADIKICVKGESGIRLGMLMISLGVHSLFEGLALGLQIDTFVLINLVIGVAVHEFLVAFAMGVNVSRLQLPRSTAFKLALIFSASIPIGQLLGLAIGYNRSSTALAASAVLQGLAAGTFIHVTFFEVIPAEFHEPGFRVLKVLTIGLGYTLLLICTVLLQNTVSRKN